MEQNRNVNRERLSDALITDSEDGSARNIDIRLASSKGAGGRMFPSSIRDIRREYDSNFIILMETHTSGTGGEFIRSKFGLDNSFVVETAGHSGRFRCLWESSISKVDVLEHTNPPQVYLIISISFGVFSEILRLCYMIMKGVEVLTRLRKEPALSFKVVCLIASLLTLAIRVGPLCGEEKILLNNWIEITFSNAVIKHLPMFKSDHAPLCLQLTNTDFKNLVKSSWDMQKFWSEGINNFRDSLKEWNTNVFGDIIKRKRTLLRRLQGITSSLSQGRNDFLEKLCTSLCKEYENVLAQEELLWYQKSR
ncbi:hypothetical protein Ahy_A01g000230 [Arachis hypogaea]|uniref:Uncharacterized protein n=1 Tax=Arachis hypogaea TaxID=3818 RepID=A0A445EJR7_ARAHY|nr:hypothetical protein Ahy_A01g000230 [Arachis hypogaea]